VALLIAAALVLAGCAAGPNDVATVGTTDTAGFWLGLWHGVISPVTFVISLFSSGVNVYEVHNNGNWYNFGFMLGIAIIFSGGAGSGRRSRRQRERDDA
jgi:hypothetical protein